MFEYFNKPIDWHIIICGSVCDSFHSALLVFKKMHTAVLVSSKREVPNPDREENKSVPQVETGVKELFEYSNKSMHRNSTQTSSMTNDKWQMTNDKQVHANPDDEKI